MGLSLFGPLRSKSNGSLTVGWVAVFALLAGNGCAMRAEDESLARVMDCVVPADQRGTLPYQWAAPQIPFHVVQGTGAQPDVGSFSEGELRSIRDAAQAWNSHLSVAQGVNGLGLESGGLRVLASSAPAVAASQLCSPQTQSAILGSSWRPGASIAIYKRTAWPYAGATSAIAITTKCSLDGSPRKQLQNAMIEVNWDYYFVSQASKGRSGVTQVPDLKSVVLHEMGHLFGLEHSCEVQAGVGIPGCSSSGLPSDYFYALMYPAFSFSGTSSTRQGEVKGIRVNDQGRANCLFGDGR